MAVVPLLFCCLSALGVSASVVRASSPPHIFAPNPTGQNFAVLVAGSNTWDNYRHQADVCHAYQVLREHGFNESNIIVMMVDDIANNILNPEKGVIINRPLGPNVYKGVVKDYTGLGQVTPTHFLNILKGDAAAMKGVGSGRVLTSGPNDNVFINFVDHGGPGIIAFPEQMLTNTELINTLSFMHAKKMYKNLVFYLEACESGSMFAHVLPANMSVFATTASNPTQSSFAIYYDSLRKTYLGDVYSLAWMTNADKANLAAESLMQQFQITRNTTNTSVVCKYGDPAVAKFPAGNFLSGPMNTTASDSDAGMPVLPVDVVSSRDVPVVSLQRALETETDPDERAQLRRKLARLVQHRAQIRGTYLAIATLATGFENAERHLAAKVAPTNFECLDACLEIFHAQCFNYGKEEYALEHAKSFTSMCESNVPTMTIVEAIRTVCADK